MKIRMITFHTPINYGAVLQAYALQTYLKSKEDDVKIINYKPDTLIKKYSYFKKMNSIRNVISNTIRLKDYGSYIKRKKKFEEFSNKYFDLTHRVIEKNEVENQAKEANIVVTGSDQVFNPTRKYQEEIDTFYLNFDMGKAKRVAYAPSFGVSSIPISKRKIVKDYLDKFDYLSARELNGKQIIEDLTEKKAVCVVDPVLLLKEKQWEQIERKVKIPEKYLLCYTLYECKLEKEVVENIAKKLGLKVVLITPNILPKIKYDKCYKDVGPEEFIYLMRNASYIVTDSFHGVVFSTLFQKEFVLTVAKEETKSRMISYLHRIGLDSRVCYDIEQIPNEKINYKDVNIQLNKKIDISKKYIDCCLRMEDIDKLENGEEITKVNTIEDVRKKCTGCGSCILQCPTKAISMKINKEGFEEPIIDKDKCVNCGKCVRICHTCNKKINTEFEEAYYGRIKDEEILEYSSSGGIYYVLANNIIKQGGLTYGAVIDKSNWEIKHLSSEKATLKEQMKSKYVQSSTYKSFEEIQNNINKGRKVLFCGTPCQVAGLKKLIGDNENLITIDFICHGVPSPQILKDKIKQLEKQYASKVSELFFRSKVGSWSEQKMLAKFENNKVYFLNANNDSYLKLFYKNYILRESCFECQYSDEKHISDITLADYWGIKKYSPDENDEKGTSLILVNSPKGKALLQEIEKELEIKPLELEKARYVYKPHTYYAKGKRDVFFKEYCTNGYESAIQKVNEKEKIKHRIINCIKRYKYDKMAKTIK